MKRMRSDLIVLIAGAILLVAHAAAFGDLCCTLQKESYDDYPEFPNTGEPANAAQSFTPQETYTVCRVAVIMNSGSGTATLYIQDGPTSGAEVYTSGTATIGAMEDWYEFDVGDYTLTADQTYYIRVEGSGFWRRYSGTTDQYPRGTAYLGGTPIANNDHWFKTFTWEDCEEPPPEGDVRIYLDADPNNHVHEIHPDASTTFDVYVCLDCFEPGQGTRGTAFLLVRTFQGFKLAQTSLLGGLDFGDAEVDPGWTIAAGADCVYPDADGVVCVGVIQYLYLGVPGTLDILPSGLAQPGTGREVLDCDFQSLYYCIHANLGVSMPPNPGEPDCECEPSPVMNTSWGGIKALFR